MLQFLSILSSLFLISHFNPINGFDRIKITINNKKAEHFVEIDDCAKPPVHFETNDVAMEPGNTECENQNVPYFDITIMIKSKHAVADKHKNQHNPTEIALYEFHRKFLDQIKQLVLDAKPSHHNILISIKNSPVHRKNRKFDHINGKNQVINRVLAYCPTDLKREKILVFGYAERNAFDNDQNQKSISLPISNLAESGHCWEKKFELELLLNDGEERILYLHEPDFHKFKTMEISLDTDQPHMESFTLREKAGQFIKHLIS